MLKSTKTKKIKIKIKKRSKQIMDHLKNMIFSLYSKTFLNFSILRIIFFRSRSPQILISIYLQTKLLHNTFIRCTYHIFHIVYENVKFQTFKLKHIQT